MKTGRERPCLHGASDASGGSRRTSIARRSPSVALRSLLAGTIVVFCPACAGSDDCCSPPAELAAPTELILTVTGPNSIRLSWQDEADDETGFKVFRGTSADSVSTLVGTAGADVVVHDDGGLLPSTTYHYRVYAFNESGYSQDFASDSAATLPAPSIQLSSDSLTFSAVIGGGNAPSQLVSITNAGGGTLGGLRTAVSYAADSGWLSATLSSTTAPATLTIQTVTSDLLPGTYAASVAVEAANSSNSPQHVDVSFSTYVTWIDITGSPCALAIGGRAYCWGSAVGDGTRLNRTKPTAVAGGLTFQSLTPGGRCGRTAAGIYYCWGGWYGGLEPTPLAPEGPTFDDVAVGAHLCGLTSDGIAYCWGRWNEYGQLGLPPLDTIAESEPNDAIASADSINIGTVAAGAIDSTNDVDWWTFFASAGTTVHIDVDAYDYDSALETSLRLYASDGTTQLAWLVRDGALTLSVSSTGQYYLRMAKTLSWAHTGWYTFNLTTATNLETDSHVAFPQAPVSGGVRFRSITAGSSHTCGLTPEGTAYCWGGNWVGQLGDGTTTERHVPTPVAGGLVLASLYAGASHTCGLSPEGVAYCWGRDDDGELGVGGATETCETNYGNLGPRTYACSRTPVRVGGGLTFVRLTRGGATCGLTAAGEAYCWGNNWYGALGDGTTVDRSVPTAVAGGLTFVRLAAGGVFTCGLTASGAAYCWGRNDVGSVGDGTTTDRLTPTRVVDP